ncbi:MAG: DUF4012 domain-containing protein [Acidimicrobiales bacterium]
MRMTAEHRRGGDRRSGRSWVRRWLREPSVAGVATAAAIGTALMGARPSGWTPADLVLSGAVGAWAALSTSRSRRWSWFTLSIAAAVVAGPTWALAVGAVAVAACCFAAFADVRVPWVGAAVGGASSVALLAGTRLPTWAAVAGSLIGLGAVSVSAYRASSSRSKRSVRRTVIGLTLAIGLAGIGYGVALAQARVQTDRGLRQLEDGLDAARRGDEAAAAERLAAASRTMRQARRSLRAPWALPGRAVPVVGPNAAAIDAVTHAAAELAGVGSEAVDDADVDAVTLTAGRVNLEQVAAMEEPLERVASELRTAEERLRDVESPWLLAPISGRLDRARAEVQDAIPDAELAADAVAALPRILGGDEPRRYFVAFVTPTEARGRTGYMGNFAELEVLDGRFSMTRFGHTIELNRDGDPTAKRVTGPADYLTRYERFDPAHTWQNVTMSPDFPSVARVIGELYPQSGGRPIDGVVLVDPEALGALLRYTGPVAVEGIDEALTVENAADFLLREQYLTFSTEREQEDALEEVARTTFERLTTGALPAPRDLARDLGRVVDGGHLLFVPFDDDAHSVSDRVGLSGALPSVNGDFLAVTTTNAGASKIDLFLRRTISYRVRWNPGTGRIEATATLVLRNEAPAEGLPDEVIGNRAEVVNPDAAPIPTGTNSLFLSFYTPWTLDAATVDGVPTDLEPGTELDRNVLSTFLDIPAGGQRTLELELSGSLSGCRYRLDVAAQPLPIAETLDVEIDAVGHGRPATSELTLNRQVQTVTMRTGC